MRGARRRSNLRFQSNIDVAAYDSGEELLHGEASGYEALSVNPVPLDHASCPQADIVERAKAAWDAALELGEKHGYRNAQTTVIAPTGTIGLVMR